MIKLDNFSIGSFIIIVFLVVTLATISLFYASDAADLEMLEKQAPLTYNWGCNDGCWNMATNIFGEPFKDGANISWDENQSKVYVECATRCFNQMTMFEEKGNFKVK